MEPVIEYTPPTVSWEGAETAPCFYDWQQVYPFLHAVLDATPAITTEMKAATRWWDWPERNLYRQDKGHDWKVFPFLHTFPATDPSKSAWVQPSVDACPSTARLLARIPGIRTALFSRLGPKTSLSTHQGWAELSNHVLRCHLGLVVPAGEPSSPLCGVVVDDTIRFHKEGDIIVFDDSKLHSAFNHHPTDSRVVLIFDILRPPTLPLGRAEGGTTEALKDFIEYFK